MTSRQCVVCKKRDGKTNLLRLYQNDQDQLLIDDKETYYGRRGVYFHRDCGVGKGSAVAKKIAAAFKAQDITSEMVMRVLTCEQGK